MVAEIEEGGAQGFPGDADTITPAEIEEVLTRESDATVRATPALAPLEALQRRRRHNIRWTFAAAFALVALGAQVAHHYRRDLAAHPALGPWVEQTYAAFGHTVVPYWDLAQYDWTATAKQDELNQASLLISARVTNRGPLAQPYPLLRVTLEDRYGEVLGRRMFEADDYLERSLPRNRLMLPGESASASLAIVDPGTNADKFELDVCIEVEANVISCGDDDTFL